MDGYDNTFEQQDRASGEGRDSVRIVSIFHDPVKSTGMRL